MKTINSFRSKLIALTLALMAGVYSFAYEFEYVNDFHIDGFAYSINSTSANNDSEEDASFYILMYAVSVGTVNLSQRIYSSLCYLGFLQLQ